MQVSKPFWAQPKHFSQKRTVAAALGRAAWAKRHREGIPSATELKCEAVEPPTPGPRTCQWPSWTDAEDPPDPPRFCGERAKPGRSYCPEHMARATRSDRR